MTEEQIQQAVDAARQTRTKFFGSKNCLYLAFRRMRAFYKVELHYERRGKPPKKTVNGYIFTLPKNTTAERDNYVIAHEFGHIILGHSIETMRLPVSENITDEDRQANIFAAEFLMPEKEFREQCLECGNDVEEVAFWFDVTPSAAGVRMVMLGIEEAR